MSSDSAARNDNPMQIRALAETEAVLNRTAAILDQRLFALDDENYRSLLAMLDASAKTDEALRERMKKKPDWER